MLAWSSCSGNGLFGASVTIGLSLHKAKQKAVVRETIISLAAIEMAVHVNEKPNVIWTYSPSAGNDAIRHCRDRADGADLFVSRREQEGKLARVAAPIELTDASL